MSWLSSPIPQPHLLLPASFLLGALVGRLSGALADVWFAGDPLKARFQLGWPLLSAFRKSTGRLSRTATILLEYGTGLLFAAFVTAYFGLNCQESQEVTPYPEWRLGRAVYHLLLIGLLVVISTTDLIDYVIPDQLTWFGTAAGLGAAVVSGDLQMIHVWVDWNAEVPGLQGPYLPAWMAAHHHLHGLVWSSCGLLTGAAAIQGVRLIAGLILGREAMGLGDVFLMGMVGSYIGWQPVVCALTIAPLCGLIVAPLVWLTTGRTFVPFGPYLALGTVTVLLTWKWIWLSTRTIFGHWPTLLTLAGGTAAAFIVLLLLVAWFRSMPVRGQGESGKPKAESGDS